MAKKKREDSRTIHVRNPGVLFRYVLVPRPEKGVLGPACSPRQVSVEVGTHKFSSY